MNLLFNGGLSPVRKLLMLKAMTGSESLVEATATGNPCTFETDVAKALKQCKVLFTPVQSGSGDPSPENERPITGWTGLTVNHSGEDTSNPTQYPVTFPAEAGTVYGGTVDLTSGVLTVEWKGITFDSAGAGWYAGYFQRSYNLTDKAYYNANSITYYCDRLNAIKNGQRGQNVGNYASLIDNGNQVGFSSMQETQSNFDAWIEENPVTFVYQLATTKTIHLTAQQITALIGENNLWSDANGNLEVKYMKKG